MKYLFISGDNFGFKSDEIHVTTETDKQISDEVYNKFFEFQSQGKQFKLKNINGTTFEEIFEEVIHVIAPQPPTEEERLQALESAISSLMGV